MNKNQLQQGDVILEAVDSLPQGIVEVPSEMRGLVLARGEHTGHAHCIVKHKESPMNVKLCKMQ